MSFKEVFTVKEVCAGCEHRTIKYLVPTCSVYTAVPSMYLRAGECPFNQRYMKVLKEKVRVGQQKQKKLMR